MVSVRGHWIIQYSYLDAEVLECGGVDVVVYVKVETHTSSQDLLIAFVAGVDGKVGIDGLGVFKTLLRLLADPPDVFSCYLFEHLA